MKPSLVDPAIYVTPGTIGQSDLSFDRLAKHRRDELLGPVGPISGAPARNRRESLRSTQPIVTPVMGLLCPAETACTTTPFGQRRRARPSNTGTTLRRKGAGASLRTASVVSNLTSGCLARADGPSPSLPLLNDVTASLASWRLTSGPQAHAIYPEIKLDTTVGESEPGVFEGVEGEAPLRI